MIGPGIIASFHVALADHTCSTGVGEISGISI